MYVHNPPDVSCIVSIDVVQIQSECVRSDMFDACVFNIFIDGKFLYLFYKIHIQSGTCAVQ